MRSSLSFTRRPFRLLTACVKRGGCGCQRGGSECEGFSAVALSCPCPWQVAPASGMQPPPLAPCRPGPLGRRCAECQSRPRCGLAVAPRTAGRSPRCRTPFSRRGRACAPTHRVSSDTQGQGTMWTVLAGRPSGHARGQHGLQVLHLRVRLQPRHHGLEELVASHRAGQDAEPVTRGTEEDTKLSGRTRAPGTTATSPQRTHQCPRPASGRRGGRSQKGRCARRRAWCRRRERPGGATRHR